MHTTNLTTNEPLLNQTERGIGDTGEDRGQNPRNVTTVRIRGSSDKLADGANEPNLSHAQDGTHNTKAPSSYRRVAD